MNPVNMASNLTVYSQNGGLNCLSQSPDQQNHPYRSLNHTLLFVCHNTDPLGSLKIKNKTMLFFHVTVVSIYYHNPLIVDVMIIPFFFWGVFSFWLIVDNSIPVTKCSCCILFFYWLLTFISSIYKVRFLYRFHVSFGFKSISQISSIDIFYVMTIHCLLLDYPGFTKVYRWSLRVGFICR